MRESYLEITFRRGRAVAAYYYLPRRAGQRSFRTEEVSPGILVDYARGGRAIGIEITSPSHVSLAAVNRVLRGLGLPVLTNREFAPLRAA